MNWQKLKRKLPRLVVNIVVIAAIVIWFVPTLGLFNNFLQACQRRSLYRLVDGPFQPVEVYAVYG